MFDYKTEEILNILAKSRRQIGLMPNIYVIILLLLGTFDRITKRNLGLGIRGIPQQGGNFILSKVSQTNRIIG